MGDLDGVYAKLDRARVHARELKARLDADLHPEQYQFYRNNDGPSKLIYTVKRLPTIDPVWSIILGDFLTNMRAALDHLAWQLVLLDGGSPNSQTQFPIRTDDLDGKGNPNPARIQPAIRRPDIVAAVEEVQPYSEARRLGGDAKNSGLVVLNELVRVDKHRLLIEVAPVLDLHQIFWLSGSDDPQPTFVINYGPLSVGTEVARFDFGDAPANPYFDPHLSLELRVYGGPAIEAIRVPHLWGLMARIYNEVEHEVIGFHFAGMFGQQPRHWANILSP